MVNPGLCGGTILGIVLLLAVSASAQQAGSIRGVVNDKDFDAPLPAAQVLIAETGQKVISTDEGNYLFSEVNPGTYTLVFSKEGYAQQVTANVAVSAGNMTEMNASLSGDFTEMEEFIVQELKLPGGTEADLLILRRESPAILDSVGADVMSRAGVSDAVGALKLVTGASVQDGKYAVVRGLPDRYVNSQMNSVRLPTADADKRAVQLDQFPAAIIESINVSKTFTPDQQGDASGGAVNVVLKSIPDKPVFQFKAGTSINTQDPGDGKFLTYKGGGVNFWGKDDGGRSIQPEFLQSGGGDGLYNGAAGVSWGDAPTSSNWALTAGGKHQFDNGVKIGGLINMYHKSDSSFYDNGIDDRYWVLSPGASMTPEFNQGSPDQGEFKTSLFDVTQSSQEVQWGGLGLIGLEAENHKLQALYLHTRTAEDVATLAEDTRGKAYYFPGYDPKDYNSNGFWESQAAPYLRNETLSYTERTTDTLQLSGWHKMALINYEVSSAFTILPPEVDWTLARSSAELNEPDKRRFGSYWIPGFEIGSYVIPGKYDAAKEAANATLGNFQRTWKNTLEESDQYFGNIKFPFKQWSDTEGYLKLGIFNDHVKRQYNQDSFSNFNDTSGGYQGEWDDFWSDHFVSEVHNITAADIDVDYKGDQRISACYAMGDIPLSSWFSVIGGARFESTKLSIVNDAEKDVTWVPPGATTSVTLNPGDADVSFAQDDVLPSIGFILKPLKNVSFRGSYSETVARQTFKELTPIQQQEYLGADIFIGNPELKMSALKNYDLRLDWTPYEGGLFSASWFHKDVKNPIEYVQRNISFTYTFPINYPKGSLQGYELEMRQDIGHFWGPLKGLSAGANATFIKSVVTLPEDESARFEQSNIMAPMTERDMTNTPSHLYNLYLTYNLERTGTVFGLYYSVKGDTLVAGAGTGSGYLIPSVYEKEYGSLNFTLSQKLWDHWKLTFQAKNLTNPKIQSVYRSNYIDHDVTKTLHRNGMEFSIGISAEW